MSYMDAVACPQHDSCIHWRATNCDGEHIGLKSCQHPQDMHTTRILLANELFNRCLCGNNGGGDCEWCLFFYDEADNCDGYKP